MASYGGAWAAADVVHPGYGDPITRLFWVRFTYFGAATMPLAWLLFDWQYAGCAPLRRRVLVALLVEPIATLALPSSGCPGR